MNVLIVGYGKIGRIKAGVWKSLGHTVLVYDRKPEQLELATTDGHSLFDARNLTVSASKNLVLDISTPAGQHTKGLQWALTSLPALPKYIVLEKPLVSSVDELLELMGLTQKYGDKLTRRMYLNESYISSVALNYVRTSIKQNNEKITGIDIELSKNRLNDTDSGRFFDYALGAIGIEVPHMIAILQLFDIDIAQLPFKRSTLYIASDRTDNQAFTFDGKLNGTKIRLKSYLGDYRHTRGMITPNQSIVRQMTVSTASKRYQIVFDPAPGVPRYHAKMRELARGGVVSEQVIDDDHLRQHLSNIADGSADKTLESLYAFDNSLQLTNALFQLSQNCRVRGVMCPANAKAEGKRQLAAK